MANSFHTFVAVRIVTVASTGFREGSTILDEDAECARAVHGGRLLERDRECAHELGEEEHGKRELQRRQDEDEPTERVEEAEPRQHRVERHQDAERRNDEHAQEGERHHSIEPRQPSCERVGGHGAHEAHEERAHPGDEAVLERPVQVTDRECRGEVRERGSGDRGHPERAVVRHGFQRGRHRQVERRDLHEGDDRQEQAFPIFNARRGPGGVRAMVRVMLCVDIRRSHPSGSSADEEHRDDRDEHEESDAHRRCVSRCLLTEVGRPMSVETEFVA